MNVVFVIEAALYEYMAIAPPYKKTSSSNGSNGCDSEALNESRWSKILPC